MCLVIAVDRTATITSASPRPLLPRFRAVADSLMTPLVPVCSALSVRLCHKLTDKIQKAEQKTEVGPCDWLREVVVNLKVSPNNVLFELM